MEHIMKNVFKSVTVLDLSHNNALGRSAKIWSRYLRRMIHIKKLYLCYYSLVCSDIEHIANALSEMTNLPDLSLRGNSSLGGSADVWSCYLRRMIHIKKLHLSDCSLVCNDIEHIANALSEMPNLTRLSLWGNSSLGQFVDVWSRNLCLMKHLQVLDLGNCSLDSNDLISVIQSLSEMTSLTIVNLCYKALRQIQPELSSSPNSSDAQHRMIYLGKSLTSTDRATISELLAKMTNPFSVKYLYM